MAQKSTLNTARKPGTLKADYSIAVASNVNTDDVVIDKKAAQIITNLGVAYDNASKAFEELYTAFKNTQKDNAKKDTNMFKQLGKIAEACHNQGTYCTKRKNDLQTLSEKTKTTDAITDEMDSALALVVASQYNDQIQNSPTATDEEKATAKATYESFIKDYNSKYGETGSSAVDNTNLNSKQQMTLNMVNSIVKNSGVDLTQTTNNTAA